MSRSKLIYWLVIVAVALPGAWLAFRHASAPRPPSVDEYISMFGGTARLLKHDEFAIGGKPVSCAGLPIIANSRLNDVAAAHPGFLIINIKQFAALSLVLQRYAFFHECGHQTVGRDEVAADCHAVQAGRREGWLDADGLEQICTYWRPDPGDAEHLPGVQRCQAMRQCFAQAAP